MSLWVDSSRSSARWDDEGLPVVSVVEVVVVMVVDTRGGGGGDDGREGE